MSDQPSTPAPATLEQCLAAYQQVVAEFGYVPLIQPGRIQLLGWDLEYVCGPALATFIDQLLVRRLNDFIPGNNRPLILDCGANIGFSVLNYKRQFPQARIIAFEPDPKFAPVLRRNLERNGAGDVRVVEAAVWVRNGKAKWFCEGIDGSHIVDPNQKMTGTVRVRTVDLSDYLTDTVDLLKLDIEGAEYQVVAHLGRHLQNVKNILIECHLDQTKIIPFSKMLGVLIAAGFKLSVNSFGTWRDLIRQTPVLPNHWEQYLLVAGWRGSIPLASSEESALPYGGAKSEIEIQTARAEIQELKEVINALQAQQRAFQAGEAQLVRALKTWFIIHRRAIETKQLEGPFMHEGGLCWSITLPGLEQFADDDQHPSRSSVILFEDDNILRPAHALHDDIRTLGGGRFSHWMSNLYFSTSDGSDPNTNDRKYIALFVNTVRESALDVRERELTVKEGDLNKRSAELIGREAEISTHAAELAAREVNLAAREADFTGSEANLNKRVAEAATHEGKLAAREAELNTRSAELKVCEAEVNRRIAEAKAHEAELTVQEAELKASEVNLNERVAEATIHEAELAKLQADLAAREAELKAHEAELSKCVAEALNHEAELTAWEAKLATREAELNARTGELKARETELNGRLAEVAAREAVYDSLFLVRIRRKLRGIFGV